jgi:hypothetical protein
MMARSNQPEPRFAEPAIAEIEAVQAYIRACVDLHQLAISLVDGPGTDASIVHRLRTDLKRHADAMLAVTEALRPVAQHWMPQA